MGQKTIDQLSTAGILTGTEEVPIWQSGVTVKLVIGSAITHNATDFDLAGSAATAQSNAEAFATAADAPDVDALTTTTDATANVVVATYTPDHNTVIHVEGKFLARSQSGTDGKMRTVNAGFITDNSGNVAIMGTSQGGDTHNTAGAASWNSNLTTNGTVVQFVVTGAAATSINWRVIGEVVSVT